MRSGRVRQAAAVMVLLSVALAGCLGSQAPSGGSNRSNATPEADNRTTPGPTGFDPADQPHVHDLWDNGSRTKVMERTVTIEATDRDLRLGESTQAGTRGCDDEETVLLDLYETCLGRAVFGVPAPDDGRAIVPPGTEAIEATVSWQDPAITGIHLQYQPAFRPGWRTFDVYAEPGETRTVRASDYEPSWDQLPLDWTDDGHTDRSQWLFAASAYGAEAPVALADGEITVEVHAERTDGELPLEPPHPAWYADNSSYLLLNTTRTVTGGPQVAYLGGWSYQISLFAESPVPPGTKQILVAVRHPNEAPTGAADPTRPEISLLYSTNASWIAFEGSDAEEAEVVDRTAERTVFRIPVEPVVTDSVYTCHRFETRWRFMVWIHGPEVPNPFFERPESAFAWYEGDIEVTGGVTERAEPSDPDALSMGNVERVPGCLLVKGDQT